MYYELETTYELDLYDVIRFIKSAKLPNDQEDLEELQEEINKKLKNPANKPDTRNPLIEALTPKTVSEEHALQLLLAIKHLPVETLEEIIQEYIVNPTMKIQKEVT